MGLKMTFNIKFFFKNGQFQNTFDNTFWDYKLLRSSTDLLFMSADFNCSGLRVGLNDVNIVLWTRKYMMLFFSNHLTCKHTNFYPNQTTYFIDSKKWSQYLCRIVFVWNRPTLSNLVKNPKVDTDYARNWLRRNFKL